MQSETIFTASSGARCQYEVSIVDGKADAIIVWLGVKPTKEDMAELADFLVAQADAAEFPHTGPEHIVLGEIEAKDLSNAVEIARARARRG